MDRRTALLMSLAAALPAAWHRTAAALDGARRATDSLDSLNLCHSHRGYADPAPTGVGAGFAAQFAGGDGAGQHFIDVERGWTVTHERLIAHRIGPPLTGAIHDASRPHGTAVLGIVCGRNVDGGCVGLAPQVDSVHVSSCIDDRLKAVSTAIDKLIEINNRFADSGGGVLLIEAEALLAGPEGGMDHLPLEALPEIHELIVKATRAGITVVEAAGNGRDMGSAEQGIDLDAYTDNAGQHILGRNSPRADSGAIIVGAARSAVGWGRHRRFRSSNYGSRIDCYAWGEGVVAPSSTTRPPFSTTLCTTDFGETSAAAAIIAGVALIVQGVVAKAQTGLRLGPGRLREILSDPALGTRCTLGYGEIGVMPNLARVLIADVLGVAPVHLRSLSRNVGEGWGEG